MSGRLSAATLDQLPGDVRRPAYDRAALSAGVVHIGLGAFHRAHQAPVFERLIEGGDPRWGVVGASLRSPAVRDALLPQDGLYSLTVEENDRRAVSIVGNIVDVIVAPESPPRLIDAIASPTTQLVSITVTEKGYKLDPASGQLLEDDPDVRADLANLEAPATMPGYLAAGLKHRKERRLPPITIASSDNMAHNGRKLAAAVTRLARAHDRALGDWVEQNCAFPNSMVDRIVPATAEADIAATATLLGVEDLAAVRTEPFSQWVIEDRLIGPTRELERAGVQVTSDLGPWEEAKLRLLNGAHSAMAYLGGLAGVKTVDAFVSLPCGQRFVDALWDELETTLRPPPQLDVPRYRRRLMQRFGNRALGHRLRQIAMDGSQKLPQRLLAPATDLLARGKKSDAIALAIAGWMKWQSGRTDNGEKFEVDDPLASTTARLVAQATNPSEYVRALMSIGSIFPPALSNDAGFGDLVADHLATLQRLGARATLEQFVCQGAANG